MISDTVELAEGKDYRHNIKMLTGVEDVRKATKFRPGDVEDQVEEGSKSEKASEVQANKTKTEET